jgi:hypothetical protein
MRYRRSKLSKNSKTVLICMCDGSLCTVDAVLSNWCRRTFGSVCTVWYPTIAVKINVDSCSMSAMPHTKHGVPVRFSQNSEKSLSPKILRKIVTRLIMDGFRCGLKFSSQLGELR